MWYSLNDPLPKIDVSEIGVGWLATGPVGGGIVTLKVLLINDFVHSCIILNFLGNITKKITSVPFGYF